MIFQKSQPPINKGGSHYDNTNKNSISNDLDLPRKDLFSGNYEISLLILGDLKFNRTCMNSFCDSYYLKSFVKKPTCFKNPENRYYINLMLKNSPNSFQNSFAIETGLSQFHKMTTTVMKMKFKKLKLRIEHYRDYKTKTFSPMLKLASICYLNCQRKILVLLSRVSRTGSLGGVGGGILTKITKSCMKIAKTVYFGQKSWGGFSGDLL